MIDSTNMPEMSGMPQMTFMPFPLIGLMQMQLSMQMQMIAQMQQFLSQVQQLGASSQQGGIQLPFNMSVDDLQRLLQLEASPKAMNILQQTLDFVFDAYSNQQ